MSIGEALKGPIKPSLSSPGPGGKSFDVTEATNNGTQRNLLHMPHYLWLLTIEDDNDYWSNGTGIRLYLITITIMC